jgi:exoribonuclease-2
MLKYRTKQGALRFATIELRAILQQGVAIKIEEREKANRAEQLIENFMIAANVGVTRYFIDHKLPVLRRVVRVPKRWNRIVELAKSLGTKLPSSPNPEALRDFLYKEQRKHPDQFPDLSIAVIKLIGRGEYVALGKEGHFDLALRDYAHTTAPNRRYPDLVMQRILKAHFFGSGGVSKKELSSIARQCTEKCAFKILCITRSG